MPDDARGYYNRAMTRYRLLDLAGAVADFSEVLRLDGPNAPVYNQRAAAHYGLGDRASAIADHRAALALDADDANACNSLAWLLATSPEDHIRDGAQAVTYATHACELTRWESAGFLDTLAAAHAECGRFDEAVRWMEKAIAILPEDDRPDYLGRLELYRSGKPNRAG
jgi:tetratricopeptide (TPR) repeat protein